MFMRRIAAAAAALVIGGSPGYGDPPASRATPGGPASPGAVAVTAPAAPPVARLPDSPPAAERTAVIVGPLVVNGSCVVTVPAACPAPPRVYGQAEYLYWWVKGAAVPPLVTTDVAAPPFGTRGSLGSPSAQVLFGGEAPSDDPRPGGRFTLGGFLTPERRTAIEGSYFFLGRRTSGFQADSNQFPLLARPFMDVAGQPSRELAASPDIDELGNLNPFSLSGAVAVRTTSDLWGAEANVRRWLRECEGLTVTGLAGFRYLELDEGLTILETVRSNRTPLTLPPAAPVFDIGNTIFVSDRFGTRNQFYGGQVGVAGEWRVGRLSVGGSAKVALGATRQRLDIAGSQTVLTPAGQVSQLNGGLLAVSSNIGRHERERFAVVPEVGARLGYQLTGRLRGTVGYDFLYWSNVLRPGDQVDLVLNPSLIPNSGNLLQRASNVQRPAVLFRETDFWAQGINAGLELRY